MTTLRGLLKLTRASIALSAAADAIAGVALASMAGAAPGTAAVIAAIGTSLALFLFGMAQNDLADRRKDAAVRPERPLPHGEVSLAAARALVLGAAALALALAATINATALTLAGSMVACITLYNLAPRHLGVAGPPLLGAIRAQNLCLGAAAAGVLAPALPAAAAFFAYITAVSVAARMEDGEVSYSGVRLRAALRIAEGAALAAPVLAARSWWLVPAGAVAIVLIARIEAALRTATAHEPPTGPALPRLIGACLSGIFLFDAALAMAAARPWSALLLVAMFVSSRVLVRRFPPS